MSVVGDMKDQLPVDIDALQALVMAACAERDAAIAERDHALSQMDRLRHLLRQLQRAQFGRRSEKLDPEQLQLAIEDIEQAVASDEAAEDKKDLAGARKRADKRRANRGALPAHLPHIDVTIAPEDTNCPCCRAPMHVLGEETSKRLDVVPAQFRVIVTHRPKFACRACTDGVVQAPAPERLIKGGLPTEAMVAYVLVAKYAWHLPLYRQAQMLLAQGIDIKRAVLAFWVGYAAAELHPLWLRLREIILTAAAPRRASSGRSRATIGRGAGPTRRRWPTPTRPVAALSTRSSCSTAIAASCNATAIASTRPLPKPRLTRRSRLLSAGLTCGGASSTLSRPVLRRSQARRSSVSPLSMPSRRRSGAAAPISAVPSARSAASLSFWRSGPGSSSNSPAARARRRSRSTFATP